ncbi:MAG: bifunctional phosphoribosylaminoimidazolecarboxamide formyltransferase/inosine monophosphate cyclohydrolase, partial [Actinobacteria bacterium]|nr:bifunctional phosphoribosylaminoimidazolecarboxamide formyltransferase/inosine monophosphate cyclohydrolase [Actinomycetota bacterium]
MTGQRIPVRRALVSVYDKSGLVELARALAGAGVEIVSTGSTATTIAEAGVPVTSVSDVTGFPEILDGRVKTLHPGIHGGLLGRSADPAHRDVMAEHGIEPFELLIVNLYPFRQTVAAGGDYEACVENIDIGGPAMVRAAAKNHESVAVVTSPAQYPMMLEALAQGGFTFPQRQQLAARAYAHTATYDCAVAQWFADQADAVDGWAQFTAVAATLAQPLRYGENPHQRAALYRMEGAEGGVAAGELLQGKEMSYNNYIDADAA